MFEQLHRLRQNYRKLYGANADERIADIIDRLGRYMIENAELNLVEYKAKIETTLKELNEIIEKSVESNNTNALYE